MKIGDRVYVRGCVDEIRKDVVIIRNEGGYFGTVESEIVEAQKAEDIVSVVRCAHCLHWDRDTLRHEANDFRDWNEAECNVLAERDGWNEINRYTEADDYCSYGEGVEE